MTDIDYAGWAQAFVAAAVIFGAPVAWQTAVRRIRTRVFVTSVPLDSDTGGSSVFWRITLVNKRNRMIRDIIRLYPAEGGVVARSVRADANDGGRNVTAEIDNGSVKFSIDRLGVGRSFEATVGLSRHSFPIVESDSGHITHIIDSSEGTNVQRMRDTVAVAQYRLMVLMLQFMAGFLVIVATLIRRGIWG